MVSPPKPQGPPKPKNDLKKLKKTQKNGPGGPGQGGRNLLSGLSVAELSMIKKLAGNCGLERTKTMRKLKMWLTGLCKKISADDSPNDVRVQLEGNFIRVWKALFYCMWMADKPLPQEQLAEQISSLVLIFTEKPAVLLLFVEWFLKTMAREWAWIDRFRLDKFMMLVRRFLRKTFKALDTHRWRKAILDEFLLLLTNQVFNGDEDQTIKSPLGFQIHVTDVYLEELAKIDSEHLSGVKVMKLISPFIKQMSFNDDERLLGEINEKIFNYLLKQSDVGIEYQESMSNGFDEDDEEEEGLDDEEDDDGDLDMDMEDQEGEDNEVDEDEDVNENRIDLEMDENSLKEDDEQEELISEDGPLDPRAGAVDVTLPQLDIDYELLAEKLETIAKNPDIKRKNRKMLMACSRGFKDLVNGIYPLALPEEIVQKRAIQKSELKKATKRLLEVDEDLHVDSKKKRTKLERKMFKKAAELAGSSNIFSSYEQDKAKEAEEMQLIDENGTENAGETEPAGKTAGAKKNKKRKDKENRNSSENKNENKSTTPISNGISNAQKSAKNKSPSVSPAKSTEKSKKSISPTSAGTSSTTTSTPLNNITPQLKKKKKKNSNSPSTSNDKNLSTSLNTISSNDNSSNSMSMKKRMSLPAMSSNPIASTSSSGSSNKKLNKSAASTPTANGDVEIILRSKLKRKVKKSSMSPYKNSPSPIKTPSPAGAGPRGMNQTTTTTSIGSINKRGKMSLMRTPISELKKKVIINLHKNTEHEHADYKQSIQRSPQIPFDALKRPISAGLLKSPLPTSPLVFRKRSLAAEFF